MRRTNLPAAALLAMFALVAAGCGARAEIDPKAGAPAAAEVIQEGDPSLVQVDHPERFPLVKAEERISNPELNVTGVVSADVSRSVPVVSLSSGRVTGINARLGDQVTKGQLMVRIESSDIAAAFADYRHAVADQTLSLAQLDRAQLLFDRGAIAQKDLEIARDAETKARVDVETTQTRLKVLGADPSRPASTVDVYAPASGVVVEQNVTAAAGVKTLDNSPNLFTIADLSHVWVLCDVYENDLAKVHVGEYADVRLNAYPGRVFSGRIGNIGPTLDPNLRTAKVRLEMANPGVMRLGMFVTATFHGAEKERHAVVPAAAVLHLHDRDWVYVPAEGNAFRRVAVTAGQMLAGHLQEIVSGIQPGETVIANALVFENTVEQ